MKRAAASIEQATVGLEPVDDAPAPDVLDRWPTHHDLGVFLRSSAPQPDCDGRMLILDRGPAVWTVECEKCWHIVALPATVACPELRAERLMRIAHLPSAYVDKPFTPTPEAAAAVAALSQFTAAWGTDARPRGPMLIGPPGNGKTHLLVRAGSALARQHHARVLYVQLRDLLDAAKKAMSHGKRAIAGDEAALEGVSDAQAPFRLAARVDLLILDDLGAERLTDYALDELAGVIDRRVREGLPMIGATNLPEGEWERLLGARTASRLAALCAPVPVTGEDWRRR